MIAIGGANGTGLFLGSGGTISQAGPGGALLAYAAIGIMVLFVMQSLGEMSTHLPVAGSFHTYGSKFVSPSFGFAMGWNDWFNWAITLAAELVAAGVIMSFWLPDVPSWIWAAIFLALLTGLNFLSAKAFGEGEFWFAAIKVTAVLAVLVLGMLMIVGIIGGESPGMSNWTRGEAPFVGGWVSIISVFMIAGFSFQGTELVGATAGGVEQPAPRYAASHPHRVLAHHALLHRCNHHHRLLPALFGPLTAGVGHHWGRHRLTLVFKRAGIAVAASVMNAVILTAILSAGNSGLYASTRMLHAMAQEGTAPRLFARVNERGVPVMALLATAVIGLFGFLSEVMGDGGAYTWLINVSGLSGFIVWVGIAWCHFWFRRAYIRQGRDLEDLPYRAPLFPIGPIIALVMLVIVIIGQNFQAIVEGRVFEVASAYIGLSAFLLLWLIHRLATGASSRTVDLDEMDVDGLEIKP